MNLRESAAYRDSFVARRVDGTFVYRGMPLQVSPFHVKRRFQERSSDIDLGEFASRWLFWAADIPRGLDRPTVPDPFTVSRETSSRESWGTKSPVDFTDDSSAWTFGRVLDPLSSIRLVEGKVSCRRLSLPERARRTPVFLDEPLVGASSSGSASKRLWNPSGVLILHYRSCNPTSNLGICRPFAVSPGP